MMDETGLAAALLTDAERKRFEGILRWHFNVVADEGKGSGYASLGVANATNDVEHILADRLARLADPATVEAVAVAVHLSTHMEPDECECRPDPEDEAAADAALAVVRGLLGGTGGEG